MGQRKIVIKQSASDSIANIAWFIESKGMLATAEKFSDSVYDYFIKFTDDKRSFALCHDPERAAIGYKCVNFKRNIR